MAGRLTRFLNLERRRTAPEAPSHELVTKARFGGADAVPVLDLDDARRLFLRCPLCEADNNVGAERCFNCQESLQTDAVRAWNSAYWATRPHGEASTPDASAGAVALDDESRRLAESLAREVGERERLRLYGSWGSGSYDPTPIGLRILRSIENGFAQVTAVALVVGLFIASASVFFVARPRSPWRAAALAVSSLIFALFTPNLRRGRRWWW